MEHLKSASLGQTQALLANIGPDFKGFPGTNTLAYYERSQITKFTTLGPVACTINVYDRKFYYRILRLRSYDRKIVILGKAR